MATAWQRGGALIFARSPLGGKKKQKKRKDIGDKLDALAEEFCATRGKSRTMVGRGEISLSGGGGVIRRGSS